MATKYFIGKPGLELGIIGGSAADQSCGDQAPRKKKWPAQKEQTTSVMAAIGAQVSASGLVIYHHEGIRTRPVGFA